MPNAANRIDAHFSRPRTGRPAVWPFVPACFPNAATTARLIAALADAGAAGIEIGVPYSDSIADGPVVQEAFAAALARGARVADVFAAAKEARRHVEVPLVAMVSASIVYRLGSGEFVSRAAEAGFDGLIVPDLAAEEAAGLSQLASAAGLRLSLLVAPTTPAERLRRIAANASGFIYYVSVAGVTGERGAMAGDLAARVAAVRAETSLPVMVGFGISSRSQVDDVCRVADGAIVGSAIVRRMLAATAGGLDGAAWIDAVAGFARGLVSGART